MMIVTMMLRTFGMSSVVIADGNDCNDVDYNYVVV